MKTKISALLITGLLIITGIVMLIGCSRAKNNDDLLMEADNLIIKGKSKAAIEILRPYVYNNENDFKAHFLLGKAFLDLDANSDKNLYLSRHYFNKASELAQSEDQRLSAKQVYADIALMMGQTGKSADTILEAADRADTIGNSEQAAKLYAQAAALFLEDENTEDAIDACYKGLQNSLTKSNHDALSLTLSRALFLKKDYTKCIDFCSSIENAKTSGSSVYSVEIEFLELASKFMLIESKRNFISINPFKKQLSDEDKQSFEGLFSRSFDVLKQLETNSNYNNDALIGRYSLILARHSKECEYNRLAKMAYRYSRDIFRKAGLEEDAYDAGKEMEEVAS